MLKTVQFTALPKCEQSVSSLSPLLGVSLLLDTESVTMPLQAALTALNMVQEKAQIMGRIDLRSLACHSSLTQLTPD